MEVSCVKPVRAVITWGAKATLRPVHLCQARLDRVLAAGELCLVAQQPEVAQEWQRLVAAVEHVTRLHNGARAANPLAAVLIDRAA